MKCGMTFYSNYLSLTEPFESSSPHLVEGQRLSPIRRQGGRRRGLSTDVEPLSRLIFIIVIVFEVYAVLAVGFVLCGILRFVVW